MENFLKCMCAKIVIIDDVLVQLLQKLNGAVFLCLTYGIYFIYLKIHNFICVKKNTEKRK